MIYLDLTKTATSNHASGLTRVTRRLREELGSAATELRWSNDLRIGGAETDWYLTAEIFSPTERPGFIEARRQSGRRRAAIFHDAIPLKHPHITWPQSVGRHPAYMKMLAGFDRVWAVSDTSRQELVEFWRWQGVEKPPRVDVLSLGADFDATTRVEGTDIARAPALLCVGIVEPRKNQSFLLEAAEDLWREGLRFELHIVGRTNPHFGAPIVARLKACAREFPGLRFHGAASDATLARLFRTARATVFPTIAEGCGLPLLESLWRGVPCVCSDLPVLRENAGAGGCVTVAVNDGAAWKAALRRVLTDDTDYTRLVREATTRSLPKWSDTAATLRSAMS